MELTEIDMARRLPPRFRQYSVDGVTKHSTFDPVREYAEKLEDYSIRGIGLLLIGGNGLGKTGALAALHNRFTWQVPKFGAKDRMWCRARDIALSYNYFNVDMTFDEPVDDLYNRAKWLVVDELGRESEVKNFERRMHSLLSMRMDNNTVTHFATNMSLEQIRQVYGEGFYSLLHEACWIVQVDGEDRRKIQ